MRVQVIKNCSGLYSPYVIYLRDCNDQELAELDSVESDYITVVRGNHLAMLAFQREQDFNWYMIKYVK